VWRLVSATAVALVIAACAPQRPVLAPRTASPAVIVVPTELPNGRIEIRVQPTYVLGTPTRIDVSIVATQGTVTGPTEARVTASGVNEAGAPAEVLVRRLDASAATVTAGGRAMTSLIWDGDDEFGARVPPDAYVLLLEFESNDGESTRTVRATATLQMND
jgi:hypothetical protein